jgi:hypothetical protein
LDFGAILGGLGLGSGPDLSTPVIIEGYNSVKGKATEYAAAIDAIPATGDATAAIKNLLTKAKAVSQSLRDAAIKIEKIPTVDLISSANLSAPGGEVTSLMDKTSDAIIAKKDAIVKANQKAAVLQEVKDLRAAVDIFTKAINAKLPAISVTAAEAESIKALASVDKVITAFS